ncbi:MAG: DeoR/GlpR transcriptional regulator [Firmicutes bacterium]|nr:DeoR/GlpR transcriptional regulator [Bacillota bacterium]
MIASERRRYILQALSQRGIVSLKDMASEMGTAEITARRDIEKLEKEGKLRRVQGGAASLEDAEEAELAMQQRLTVKRQEKAAIAAFAATLVEEGDVVFLDSGTSMIPLAVELLKRRVTIVTNNTMFFNYIQNPTGRLIMIGGEHIAYYEMNVGVIAQDMIRQFSFDKAFLGCSGLDLPNRRVCGTELQSVEIKRLVLAHSQKKYLLLDSSKFEGKGFMKVCETSEFDQIICDRFPFPEDEKPDNLVSIS